MLVNTKEMFQRAKEGGYAIAAPDYWDSVSCKTFVKTCEKLGIPTVLSYAQAHLDMQSLEEAYNTGSFFAKQSAMPVALHLDHGQSFDFCKRAIDLGFTSVMIDASMETFEKNVEITKQVVEYAHAHGVTVEAELGHVGTGETYASEQNDSIYTEVEAAVEFVKLTGVDSLAVSIGTAHGKYKKAVKPVLDFERLHDLAKSVPVPLVLHGGSGSGDDNLERCALEGITKINVFTDFTVAALKASAGKEYDDLFVRIREEEEGIANELTHYASVFHTQKWEK